MVDTAKQARDADQLAWTEHGRGRLTTVFGQREAADLARAQQEHALGRASGFSEKFAALKRASVRERHTDQTRRTARLHRGKAERAPQLACHSTAPLAARRRLEETYSLLMKGSFP